MNVRKCLSPRKRKVLRAYYTRGLPEEQVVRVLARARRARLLGIEATVATGTAIRPNVNQTGHEPFDDPAWQRSRRAGKLAIRALMFCWSALHTHDQNVAYGHSLFCLSAIPTRRKIKSCLSPVQFQGFYESSNLPFWAYRPASRRCV